LQNGMVVPGAELVRGESLKIRWWNYVLIS
jgi:hypothetical protein